MTDVDGEIFQHLEYFPFGETWVEESSNTQRTPYLFTGKELDEETGLYYFGARYYDPRTSVWQSPDPILASYMDGRGNSGGVYTPVNLSLFAYARQKPVILIDPDGRDSMGHLYIGGTWWDGLPQVPNRDDHYNRNQNQSFPPTRAELNELEARGFFKLEPPVPANAHQMGTNFEGANPRNNEKVTTTEGGEAIYNSEGALVQDLVNQGTFNFASPSDEPVGHGVEDVVPYVLWGNSPDDPTTMLERALGLANPSWGYRGDVNLTYDERQAAEAAENNRMLMQTYEFWFGSD